MGWTAAPFPFPFPCGHLSATATDRCRQHSLRQTADNAVWESRAGARGALRGLPTGVQHARQGGHEGHEIRPARKRLAFMDVHALPQGVHVELLPVGVGRPFSLR